MSYCKASGTPRGYNRTAPTKFDYYKLLTDFYSKTDPGYLVRPTTTKEGLRAQCKNLGLV